MENKLQELTRKLYNEGLSKGQQDAEQLVADAQTSADQILDDARREADEIIRNAKQNAEDLKRNTLTETAMISREMIGALKQQIEELVIFKGVSPGVKAANADPQFIKDMLLTVARNWHAGSSSKIDLSASLPAEKQAEWEEVIKSAAAQQLGEGFEIRFEKKIKSGFRIGPKDGGYYISFSDADFDALLSDYLRPQVAKILFGQPQESK